MPAIRRTDHFGRQPYGGTPKRGFRPFRFTRVRQSPRRASGAPGAPGRRVFIGLTPNGGYWWYRHLAPRLGLDTRHLSTDRFLTSREVEALIGGARLALQRLEHWRLIPQGDLPVGWGYVLRALDWVGGYLRIGYLRGGLAFSAVRTD